MHKLDESEALMSALAERSATHSAVSKEVQRDNTVSAIVHIKGDVTDKAKRRQVG